MAKLSKREKWAKKTGKSKYDYPGSKKKKKKSKLSKREKWAKKTGKKKENYPGSKKKKSKKKSKKKDYSKNELVDTVLKVTPREKDPLPLFEETYTPEREAEDRSQAEALFKPYYEMEIAKALEDLNAWAEMESIDYERTLRRGRASLAEGGGAIGGERETFQKEVGKEHEMAKRGRVRTTERAIGTEKTKGAGYQSSGLFQEGSMIGKMKSDISGESLRLRGQAQLRYDKQKEAYYSTSSDKTFK